MEWPETLINIIHIRLGEVGKRGKSSSGRQKERPSNMLEAQLAKCLAQHFPLPPSSSMSLLGHNALALSFLSPHLTLMGIARWPIDHGQSEPPRAQTWEYPSAQQQLNSPWQKWNTPD